MHIREEGPDEEEDDGCALGALLGSDDDACFSAFFLLFFLPQHPRIVSSRDLDLQQAESEY